MASVANAAMQRRVSQNIPNAACEAKLTGGRSLGILLRDRYSGEEGSLRALRMGLCDGDVWGEF